MSKLYGVGLGPGDAELVTLRAVKVLECVSTVFAPASGHGTGIAVDIARKAVGRDFRTVSLYFPMRKEREKLEQYWSRAADKVSEILGSKGEGAFVTLGDPLFYSTFSYLMKNVIERGIDCEVVPGITSLSACSASAGVPLAEGGDRVAVIPAAYGLENLDSIAREFDTIVLMKVSRSYSKIVERLRELGLEERAVFLSRCGSGSFSLSKLEEAKSEKPDYLSMVLIR